MKYNNFKIIFFGYAPSLQKRCQNLSCIYPKNKVRGNSNNQKTQRYFY